MADVNLEGMVLAEGVVETIAGLACKDIEGVAAVGGQASATAMDGILTTIGQRTPLAEVEVAAEGGGLAVGVHIAVEHGRVLPEVASAVRDAVANAVLTQVGVPIARVDVYIDAIQF